MATKRKTKSEKEAELKASLFTETEKEKQAQFESLTIEPDGIMEAMFVPAVNQKPQIQVKRLHQNAVIPKYSDELDSGFDLYTVEETVVLPGQSAIAKTGISVSIPPCTEIQIRPRSGIGLKGCPTIMPKWVLAETTLEPTQVDSEELRHIEVHFGTIDEGYRGEIGIIVYNPNSDLMRIPKGIRLAQGVLAPVIRAELIEVEELSKTNRGDRGYGGSGVK